MDYVKLLYRPLATRAALHVLVGRNRAPQSPDRGRFTRRDVDDLLKKAWIDYEARSKRLSPEPTFGSRMNVRLACFTMSFFDALLAVGTDRDFAINLIADTAWRVYRLWSMVALSLARLTPGRTTSLAFAINKRGGLTLGFPLTHQATSSNPFRPGAVPPSMSSDVRSRITSAAKVPSTFAPRRGAISIMRWQN